MADQSPIEKAANTISTKGPEKHEAAKRRVRFQLGGSYIFDTISARLVWEHPWYPQYYVPRDSLKGAVLHPSKTIGEGENKVTIHDVEVNGTVVKNAALEVESGPLKGFVRPDFAKMEAVLEEDDPIRGHPTDPYKRIDVRSSSRPIRIAVGGKVVAESTRSVHLFETGLPDRYYIPRTAVKPGVLLKPSSTTFYCPYKGHSSYFDVVPEAGAEPVKDIVWYYETPLLEVLPIRDLICFYNEKVDMWIDGVKQ